MNNVWKVIHLVLLILVNNLHVLNAMVTVAQYL